MTAVVDAIDQRYEFLYDPLGRLTQEKKGSATKSFVYDAAGNRSQRTDYNGAITNYSYDTLNRLTTISYPDTTSATYGYDVLSRLTTATNPTGTVTIAYDNRNRVSSVTDVFGQIVSYQYDANSNRTQLNLNGAPNASYQYDVINRLTQLTDNAGLNTTFVYDATNKLTSRTLPNGVVSTYDYDGLNRLTRLRHAKGVNTLADFQYQFDTINNITQMTDGAGAHNYTYDSLNRLTSATHPNQPNESYTYDDVGNRTASHQGSSYNYQSFNRLVSANGTTFGYDTNGNQISKSDLNGSWTYNWDFENRLKQASVSGGVVVNYSYDALGRRVQQTSSTAGTTRFIYDGLDVVRDLDATGAITADYLNGLGLDQKLRQTTSGTSSYVLADQLQTPRLLTDAAGLTSFSVAYDSSGNIAGGGLPSRYTFTGREIDSETGMMYYRARWYDSKQGRFNSEDPIGFRARDINLYRYAQGNPLLYVDPTGLRRCNPLLGAIIGGLVGGASGAVAGAGLGAVAGGIAGGVGLSFVVPGVGTIAGFGGGAAVGAQAGAYVGSGIGVGLGIGLGIDYCNGSDDACDKPPKVLPFPKVEPVPVPRPKDLDDCIKRLVDCLRFAGTDPRRSEECRKAFEACKEQL